MLQLQQNLTKIYIDINHFPYEQLQIIFPMFTITKVMSHLFKKSY